MAACDGQASCCRMQTFGLFADRSGRSFLLACEQQRDSVLLHVLSFKANARYPSFLVDSTSVPQTKGVSRANTLDLPMISRWIYHIAERLFEVRII